MSQLFSKYLSDYFSSEQQAMQVLCLQTTYVCNKGQRIQFLIWLIYGKTST